MIKKILFCSVGVISIGMMTPLFLNQTVSESSQLVISPQNNNENNILSEAFPATMEGLMESALSILSNNETHIVAIGDSLTQGVGDETDGGGYVGILDRSINEYAPIAEIDNLGKRGNRSDQLLHRLDDEEITASIQDANMILITIGANDIMQVAKENILNLELNDFIEERVHYEQRLHQILDHIKNLNQTANIYLIGFYNPFEQYFRDIKELNMIVDAYNQTGIDIAKQEKNVMFIPIIDLFRDPNAELFAEDNFHPNYQGYRRIAERVLEYITMPEGERHVQP